MNLLDLRIEIRETKKYGLKPILLNGINGKIFYCQLIKSNENSIFMIFNIDGTRGIESVYVHGVWKIN